MMKKLEKADGQSMDVVADNVAQLKELFPEVFAEGKIDFNRLEEVLGNYVNNDEDHYNFTWHGKRAAGRLAQTPSTGTLRPCPKESVDWDKTQNLFIEGDNLEVLKLLQKSYHRQIKMIYIDPPYNTGNDFVYEDDFNDGVKNYLAVTGQLDDEGKKKGTNSSAAGRYHTNWLNMMYPRLKLARNLLRDDGAIFISIDDNEQDNLKKLCNEVFGEENFVANIIWQSRTSISDDHFISLNHNHTLIYSKNVASLKFYGERLDESEYQNRDNDARGPWKLVPLDANKPGGNTHYPIRNPNTNAEHWPPEGRSWSINPDEFNKLLRDNRVAFGFGGDTAPKRKLFLHERLERGDTKTPSSILLDAGTTKDGSEEIVDLFGKKKIFSYPKPTSFLKRLLQYGLYAEKDQIVLDFFAGSGTTAHATMLYNQENAQNARYIMVQIPERCDEKSEAYKAGYGTLADISKERIRRAAQKIKDQTPLFNGDLGFKVFKLDTSNIKTWEAGFDTLKDDLIAAADYIKQDRSPDDIVFELLLKYGLNLTVPIETRTIAGKKVYSIGLGALVVCLDTDVPMETVKGIGALKEELKPEIMRVVFKDSGFKDDVVKTNALQTLKRFGIEDIKSL